MSEQDIKIILAPNPMLSEVWIDGNKLRSVCAIRIESDVDSPDTKIEIEMVLKGRQITLEGSFQGRESDV
jgi:hypothetical protein